jgi:uncharacterized protein YkwD
LEVKDSLLARSRSFLALLFYFVLAANWASARPAMSSQQKQLFDLVNTERRRHGLSPLQWDDQLAEAARTHTRLMVSNGDLSHQFRGEAPLSERAGRAGAHFNSVAENVAYAGDVRSLHENLMNSPHHRANILNPDSNAIGIAFAQRGNELYVTEDFAHLLATYTREEFQDQVIAVFNRLRQRNGLAPLRASSDAGLHQAACAANPDPHAIIGSLPGAIHLAVFTASQPSDLPLPMQEAAWNKRLRRMNIGVCFKPDGKSGFSKYWVVAAFYPTP